MFLGFLPSSVAGWTWETVLPLYVRQLGVSMVGVGTIFTAETLLGAIISAPAGWLADKHNRARTYALGTLLTLAGGLALLAPPSLFVLFVFIILFELGTNVAFTSRYSLALDLIQEDKRGAVFGLFHTLSFLLPVGGGVVAGALLNMGFRPIFAVCALMTLAAFLIRLRIRDPHREPAQRACPTPEGSSEPSARRAPRLARLADRMRSVASSFCSDMLESWTVLLRSRCLLNLVLVGVLGSLGFGVSSKYFIIYFREVLGFSYLAVGSLFSVHALGYALGGFFGGLLCDRLGRQTALVLSSLTGALFTVALVYVRSPETAALVFFLLALTGALWPVAFQVLVGELSPGSHRGRLFAVMDVSTTAALATGPVLGGWIWHTIGPAAVLVIDAVISLSCGAVLSVSMVRMRRQSHEGREA